MSNWNITLTRINGKPFEVDIRQIVGMTVRRDGGTNLNATGTKTPCRENMLEVAQLMNDRVKEASHK